MSGTGTFGDMFEKGSGVVKNGLCVICKGARRLCGKDRCPLMIKFYSRARTMPVIDVRNLAGSSPPGVFVGRYGYPKVDVGPLVPGEFGDTAVMDRPEMWMGKSIDDIVDMRYRLVRGKYRIDATDFAKSGRIVEDIQGLALSERPVDVEAGFRERPHGLIVLDDDIQPFGPAARLESFRKGNGRWEHNLEKGYYDTDLNAAGAVVEAYKGGTPISEIQKAFSVGTMGIGKNRRFVPTRWSITAVDDIIGKDYLKRTRFYRPIDSFRVYYWEQLDNRWAVVMMPTTWRFELIEAWYPGTSWNPVHWTPGGDNIEIIHDSEFFNSRSEYAHIGGCYYASRMAVNELLEKEHRTAGAVICREAHEGYVMPVGVWNVRENVRAALRTRPLEFPTLDAALGFVTSKMDLGKETWVRNSDVFTDWYSQGRLEDYFGASVSDRGADPSELADRGDRRGRSRPLDRRFRKGPHRVRQRRCMGRGVPVGALPARPGPFGPAGDGLRAEPLFRVRARVRLLLRARGHPYRLVLVEGGGGEGQRGRKTGEGALGPEGDHRHRDRDRPLSGGRGQVRSHPRMPGGPVGEGVPDTHAYKIRPHPEGPGPSEGVRGAGRRHPDDGGREGVQGHGARSAPARCTSEGPEGAHLRRTEHLCPDRTGPRPSRR